MTTTGFPQIESFAQAQDVLAANLPGYTRRERQEHLGAAIEQAAARKRHLLAQAGTGIGKSLAALIPAIIWAKANHQRVVVATSTKALQTQYARKDLPFLQEHLGIDFTWAVIKGRSNYACLAKVDDLKRPTPGQLQVLRALEEEGPGFIADRDELPTVDNPEWGGLSMSAAECPGRSDCPFAVDPGNRNIIRCHAELAKAKAAQADIVITNTAYLITDLKLRAQSDGAVNLLGEYGLLIIDEAHNLKPPSPAPCRRPSASARSAAWLPTPGATCGSWATATTTAATPWRTPPTRCGPSWAPSTASSPSATRARPTRPRSTRPTSSGTSSTSSWRCTRRCWASTGCWRPPTPRSGGRSWPSGG
jgi:hypothetical protein